MHTVSTLSSRIRLFRFNAFLCVIAAFLFLQGHQASAQSSDVVGEWTGSLVDEMAYWDNNFSHKEAYSGQKLIVKDHAGSTFGGTLEAKFANPTTGAQQDVSLPFVAVFTDEDSFIMSTRDQFFAVGKLKGKDELDLMFVTGGRYHSAGKYTLTRKK